MVAGIVFGAGAGATLGCGGGTGVTDGAEAAVDSAAVVPVSPLPQALVTTPRPAAPANQSALRRLKRFAGLADSNAHMAVTIGQLCSARRKHLGLEQVEVNFMAAANTSSVRSTCQATGRTGHRYVIR
jgi:hypothetical protein